MKYTWNILDIETNDDLIVSAKYSLIVDDGENTVSTEGNWTFLNPEKKVEFKDVIPADVISWIENDTRTHLVLALKSNLEKQLETLKQAKKQAPWIKPTFTVKL